MPGFDSIAEVFRTNFSERGEIGASVSVWRDGEEIVQLSGGHCDRDKTKPWTEQTMVLVWSANKGVCAASVLHALDGAGVPLEARVATVWPEFAAAGKGDITFAQILSHQAGLAALQDATVSVFDHEGVTSALAAQEPLWGPGSHGYHPCTAGYLWDEIVRRIAGVSLSQYWRTHFADPLGLDFWIGVPESEHGRIATLHASRTLTPPANETTLYRELTVPGTLPNLAFSRPAGLGRASAMNGAAYRSCPLPAVSGIGTARALAKFYSHLSRDPLSQRASQPLVSGSDLTLLRTTSFSAGFMLDPLGPDGNKLRRMMGPSRCAFGHPGAGGSLAFADPKRGIGFAYVMNQMELGTLPGPKVLRLVDALYESIE